MARTNERMMDRREMGPQILVEAAFVRVLREPAILAKVRALLLATVAPSRTKV